ncbi:MAG TPA: Do family serine endopeptidase [Vicinamibacterales bacterium]|nr:Do family serine endopeptidase [Vicinamibacterales bacterium]
MNESPIGPRRSGAAWLRIAALGLAAAAAAAGISEVRSTLSASAEPQTRPPAAVALPGPLAATPAPSSYSAVVDTVAPAVVTIRVEKTAEMAQTALPGPFGEFFGGGVPERRRQGGLGSGVIVRPDGLILTNHHVIDHADRIRVDLADGRSLPATLVGSDQPSDLAVLRIAARDLPVVPYGDSERIKVGDVVLAFGNPLGVGQTVTMGIVSAKGRATGISDGAYEDFLQTDAPINQGNSGGALVNLRGELVGINAQILSPSGGNIGLGFAIPSSMARAVADQLATDGVVHRAKLGVTVQGLTPELAESLGASETRGALVSDVEPGGPGARAGLKQGDLVLQIDGHPVTDANRLRNQIAGTRPGSSITLTVRRNGRDETLTARLEERERPAVDEPEAGGTAHNESGFGMAVMPITPRIAEQLELPRTATGLVVTDVDPAGLAASAGVREGDVIKTVNGQTVTSASALRAALKTQPGRPALMLVSRRGADAFVALPRAES